MKIICLVKCIPDVDSMEYDYEKNVLLRNNCKQTINPDDACALGFALSLKKKYSDVTVEVVTMAPLSTKKIIEDILRRGIDKATILSDLIFSGSDTFATSLIIGEYIKNCNYDVILSGSHSLDGDTAHIPPQIAEILGINQISFVTRIDEESFLDKTPIVTVETEEGVETYEIPFPAIIGICRESKYRLPFVRFADLDLDVANKINIYDNNKLKIDVKKVGLEGSLTRVQSTYEHKYEKKNKLVVSVDDTGISTVYSFLKENGYLK